MEKIHNINLQPLKSVRAWDTKRVKAYKNRIQKHISYLETNSFAICCDHVPVNVKQAEVELERFRNYKAELKKILAEREHVD